MTDKASTATDKLARVRFTADKDFTPDHRTIAFTEGLEMPAPAVMEIFAVETIDELRQAFAAYQVPAEILEA